MPKKAAKTYQDCRRMTGLTQLEVAERLHMSVHHLARVERGIRSASLDMVADMANFYNEPVLLWQHLKDTLPVSVKSWIPEWQEISSNSELGFQSILLADEATNASCIIKTILADGEIDESERKELERFISLVKSLLNRSFSISNYADCNKGA